MAKRYYVPFPEQGGGSYMPMPRHVLRIGDAEREAAAADLGEHYAAGRLNLDELHERLGGVFAAKTHGQLSKIMADLPSTRRPDPSASDELLADEPRQIDGRKRDTPSDRAGRIAAVSLLILAMLLWLFTALLFSRHGYYPYHPGGGPWGGPGTGPWGGGH